MRTEFRRWTRFWQSNKFQGICGTIRKQFKKFRTDIQLKSYTVVARPSLLCGSETWVTTKRDMTCLEDTEMCFQRSATGCTRLDKIWSEVISLELEINGIQYMRLNYKQNWKTTLEERTTPDSRHTPSTTNNDEDETVVVPRKDCNASMPEQVKQPNPWRRRWCWWWHLIDVTVLIQVMHIPQHVWTLIEIFITCYIMYILVALINWRVPLTEMCASSLSWGKSLLVRSASKINTMLCFCHEIWEP